MDGHLRTMQRIYCSIVGRMSCRPCSSAVSVVSLVSHYFEIGKKVSNSIRIKSNMDSPAGRVGQPMNHRQYAGGRGKGSTKSDNVLDEVLRYQKASGPAACSLLLQLVIMRFQVTYLWESFSFFTRDSFRDLRWKSWSPILRTRNQY